MSFKAIGRLLPREFKAKICWNSLRKDRMLNRTLIFSIIALLLHFVYDEGVASAIETCYMVCTTVRID
jgi:hypothetical protein